MLLEELAQEKAIQLITKFKSISNLTEKEAIQCANLTCDEILNESKMKFCGQGTNDQFYRYWVEVKRILTSMHQQ